MYEILTHEASVSNATFGDNQNISTLSCLNYSYSDEISTLEASVFNTTFGDKQNISTLSCLNYSFSNKGLTLKTLAYITLLTEMIKAFQPRVS